MEKKYDTGLGKNEIKFELAIGTIGLAYTKVHLKIKDGHFSIIKESSANSGNIPKIIIGMSNELKEASLAIITTLDFSFLPVKERELAISKLSIKYILSGGFSGNYSFGFDPDDLIASDNNKIVTVSKAIFLT